MPDNDRINWDDLRMGYNRIYKTCFTNNKEFLTTVYKIKPSVHKIGKILGVAHTTVLDKMISLNIPRLSKGHRGNTEYQNKYRGIKNPEKLRNTEIAKIVGCSVEYTYALPKIIAKWDGKDETKGV